MPVFAFGIKFHMGPCQASKLLLGQRIASFSLTCGILKTDAKIGKLQNVL